MGLLHDIAVLPHFSLIMCLRPIKYYNICTRIETTQLKNDPMKCLVHCNEHLQSSAQNLGSEVTAHQTHVLD
jgi:hypothetical protein